tara:strand:- start:376 stop:735 length:360 start_codon:yes stop_codon:yes gene_type:complete
MVKEKLIHWRNIQSPLLYDVGRHVDGPRKYWDIDVKEIDGDGGSLERVRVYLKSKGIQKHEYKLVVFENQIDLIVWEEVLNVGKWNLTLRTKRFGIAFYKDLTESKNLILGGRLRIFNV